MINKKTIVPGRGYLIVCILSLLVVISSCKKKTEPEPEQETGTVTDIDGNIYKTVKIGDQWWMAENLRVKKYRDNTGMIETPKDETNKWKMDTTGTYCINPYNYVSTDILYNGYVIQNTKNIAPEGWRIPSDEDWKQLERFLGMSGEDADKTSWRGSDEGEKLKIKQEGLIKSNWTPYGEVWGTNESGFTACPSMCRMYDGSWGDNNGSSKNVAFFWSSTPHDSELWYRYLDYKNKNVFRYYGPKKYGFSIRCIKN